MTTYTKQFKQEKTSSPQSGLPNLPRVINKREANFGDALGKWFLANPRATCSVETKHTRGKNYFNYSELEDNQITYAKNIQKNEKGTWIRVQGTNGQPDYIYLNQEPAYIAIKYPNFFCLITIGNLLHEKGKTKSKSLTAERAKAIATLIV